MDLPIEIRNMVYAHALEDKQLRLRARGQQSFLPGMRPICAELENAAPPALADVSPQIRSEVKAVMRRDMKLNITYLADDPRVTHGSPWSQHRARRDYDIREARFGQLFPRPIAYCIDVPKSILKHVRKVQLTFVDSTGQLHVRDNRYRQDPQFDDYSGITTAGAGFYHDAWPVRSNIWNGADDHASRHADRKTILGLTEMILTLPKLVELDLRVVLNLSAMKGDELPPFEPKSMYHNAPSIPGAETYFAVSKSYQDSRAALLQRRNRVAPKTTTSLVLASPSYSVAGATNAPAPSIQHTWTRHQSLTWQLYFDSLWSPALNRIFYTATPASEAEIAAGHSWRGLSLDVLRDNGSWSSQLALAERQKAAHLRLGRRDRVRFVYAEMLRRHAIEDQMDADNIVHDELVLMESEYFTDEVEQGDWFGCIYDETMRSVVPCLCGTHGDGQRMGVVQR